MPRTRRLFPLLISGLLAAWSLPSAAAEGGEEAVAGTVIEDSVTGTVIEDSVDGAVVRGEAFTPRPQRVFTERPRIEEYADYSSFLVDVMEYRRQKSEAVARAAARAAATAPAEPVAGSTDPDLYRISGPESLDEALARAKKLQHPVYSEAERYGRTTSSSFPIQPLDRENMSSNEIAGQLNDMESLNPDTYREQDAIEANVSVVQGRKPTNDAAARNDKAEGDSDAYYRPTYDYDNRIGSDSEGKVYRIPTFIANEVDYTVIRRADFSSEIIKR